MTNVVPSCNLPFTCSKDLILDEDFVESTKGFNTVVMTTTVLPFEQFCPDSEGVLPKSDPVDLDPILEICTLDESEGVALSLVDSIKPQVLIPSPDKEFMDHILEHSSGHAGVVRVYCVY